jgi:hypothetical protein
MASGIPQAIEIATRLHGPTLDRGGEPYILHPMRMLIKSRSLNVDPELRDLVGIVCCLHDVIEDTKCTYEELRACGFSEDVIASVRSVTKAPGETYAESIVRCSWDIAGTQVKILDLEDNMAITRLPDVTQKDFDRIRKYYTAHSFLIGRMTPEQYYEAHRSLTHTGQRIY